MENIDKFVEPTYQNRLDIIPLFDQGFGVGRASGYDRYGCAHNQYTYCDGAGNTSLTRGIGIGIGSGNSLNELIISNHEKFL